MDDEIASGAGKLVARLRRAGFEAGLDSLGLAPADMFSDARAHLEGRRRQGYDSGMAFTYRNPGRSTDPQRALPGAMSLVVGARAYVDGPDSTARSGRGVVARFARHDHYSRLRTALEAVAAVLRAEGWRARVCVDDNALVDRPAAHRAGLGWFGKNACLVLPGQGSWFVLGSVVTDARLPADPLTVADGCGSCRVCVDRCPTGAIVEPGVIDARRCIAWLVQSPDPIPARYRVAVDSRLYGCDRCQEVCPLNRLRAADPHAEGPGEATVDLVELLRSDDEQLLDRFGRWYIPDRNPDHLRRTALVVLGNVADGADGDVVHALHRSLSSPEPTVRAHSVWAARRLGRADLLDGLDGDGEPQIAAELERTVRPRSRRSS